MLHKQSFYCLSKITSIILWIQLACVQFSQYPVLLEIQYKVMFRRKVMWSRGPHRPVAWNKVCSGVNNNQLDPSLAAIHFPLTPYNGGNYNYHLTLWQGAEFLKLRN